MAVLVEAISVIVRRDAIARKFAGGWSGFVAGVPNATLCFDEELARVGFMSPTDTEAYVGKLEGSGLTFLVDEQAVDIAIADQQQGLLVDCDWLEYARLNFDDCGEVGACWLYDGPRFAYGTYLPSGTLTLATPPDWDYENSLSKEFHFAPDEEMGTRLRYLRSDGGLDVYWDKELDKEVFIGRAGNSARIL